MTVSHDMFVRVYFYRPVKSNGTRSDTSTSTWIVFQYWWSVDESFQHSLRYTSSICLRGATNKLCLLWVLNLLEFYWFVEQRVRVVYSYEPYSAFWQYPYCRSGERLSRWKLRSAMEILASKSKGYPQVLFWVVLPSTQRCGLYLYVRTNILLA